MNYKRAWDTLKAESGYRDTKAGLILIEDYTIKELMDKMEKRMKKEEMRKENTDFLPRMNTNFHE